MIQKFTSTEVVELQEQEKAGFQLLSQMKVKEEK